MSWLDPPPVVIITGQDSFLVRREIAKAIAGAHRKERRVEYVDGGDKAHLSKVLASGSVLFKGTTLVIVRNADKVDVALVLAHQKRKSNKISLVLHKDGDLTKKGALGKIAAELPKKLHLHFKEASPWKKDEQAVKFLRDEAKREKLTLSEKMAEAIVAAAGSDLGILYFELEKIALLMRFEGTSEVQAAHVRQTLSSLSQIGAIPVVDALGARHESRLVRTMATMRRTHSGDPTMQACALIGRNVVNWLHVASLLPQGATEDEISVRVGMHPYICKTKLIPVARSWGEENLAGLLSVIARVERAVRSGHVSPWIELETMLIKAIRRARGSVS